MLMGYQIFTEAENTRGQHAVCVSSKAVCLSPGQKCQSGGLLSLGVKHSRQMVGPTNCMPLGLHLELFGSWSLSSSICSALWNACLSYCRCPLYSQFLPFFLSCFSLQLNNKKACSEFRNTDTAISCNISSDSCWDMQSSKGPVYTINVIISESGYITVYFPNPVINMVSICRVDRTRLWSSLPCRMEWGL